MSIRTERLGSVIQQDLGDIIQKNYQHDTIITVTKVRVTPDLLIAKVYFSIMASGRDPENVFAYLEENNAEIRKKLASRIKNQVRRIPELHFYRDDTAEYVNRMEQLFSEIREERRQRDQDKEQED